MTKRHNERENVWAVVRYDDQVGSPEDAFTIKQALHDQAQAEVVRLNALNGDKACRYWTVMTRLFPPGQSAGPAEFDR
ncbi:MAG: hypothetical protein GC162_02475 [Planctomycetes bacterium]|nr:hypothetical protein [Planctomycetota bacterium]